MSEKILQPDDQAPDLEVYPAEADDDAPGGVPDKPRRAPQLRTVHDVTEFAAHIIRAVYRGKMDAELGTKLTYMLNGLRASLSDINLEAILYIVNERLDEVEAEIDEVTQERAAGEVRPEVRAQQAWRMNRLKNYMRDLRKHMAKDIKRSK